MKISILFSVLLLISSCQKETIGPTGSLKLTYIYRLSTPATGPAYSLYTELSYARNDALAEGMMGYAGTDTYQVTLSDLNPGNYVVRAGVGTISSSRVVQVTAGRERAYTF